MPGRIAICLLIASALLATDARSDATPSAAGGVARVVSLFTIAKSENKIQVLYAISLDEHCAPASSTPVFAYWRMLERGPAETEPLLANEQGAYGLQSERVTSRRADGGAMVIALNALPQRTVLVETTRGASGACRALSTTTIAGQSAHLFNVYVKLKWLFTVDYLLLQGWSTDGTHVLSERLTR